jgi:sporulation protein YlmC with PRC-barrel domain
MMKRSLKSLIGYTMGASDGEIGYVKEFYFDDETWTIRYLIVETGNWLMGREILISPQLLSNPDWNDHIFPVNLSKVQIMNSPDIDTEKPVSRQQEIKLHYHYLQSGYWGDGLYAGITPVSKEDISLNNRGNAVAGISDDTCHLRSSAVLTGYTVKAADGEIGKVEDFILQPGTWKIGFLVVDTGHWLPGKKVLIAPEWIMDIDWENSALTVQLSITQVQDSPEYDPAQTVTEAHELQLHNYYGQFVSHVQ